MKKTLLISLLVCAILASVVTGTLSVYSSSIDVTSGDVVAKSFVLTSEESLNFDKNFKIAPGEEIEYTFDVRNFDPTTGVVTETAMVIDTIITMPEIYGKKNLPQLVVTVYRMIDGEEVDISDIVNRQSFSTQSLNEAINFTDRVGANVSTTIRYKIVIEWQGSKNDIEYQGEDFGNKLKINVKGTQVS